MVKYVDSMGFDVDSMGFDGDLSGFTGNMMSDMLVSILC